VVAPKLIKIRIADDISAILILATDEHGETRINTEEFSKLTIKQKNKYSFVKIRDNPCKSVAKKIQNENCCIFLLFGLEFYLFLC
jgi:hypothetical protein